MNDELYTALEQIVDLHDLPEKNFLKKYPELQSERLINGSAGLRKEVYAAARSTLAKVQK